eukprot:9245413-Pyramimonas_sp.AAC.2
MLTRTTPRARPAARVVARSTGQMMLLYSRLKALIQKNVVKSQSASVRALHLITILLPLLLLLGRQYCTSFPLSARVSPPSPPPPLESVLPLPLLLLLLPPTLYS